jgi:hypothetical protein
LKKKLVFDFFDLDLICVTEKSFFAKLEAMKFLRIPFHGAGFYFSAQDTQK